MKTTIERGAPVVTLINVFTVELVWPQEAARCGQLVAVPALAGIAPS